MTTAKDDHFQRLEELLAAVPTTEQPAAPAAEVAVVASASVEAGGKKNRVRTPERLKRKMERQRERRANLTPEQRARHMDRRRRANLRPEQLAQIRERDMKYSLMHAEPNAPDPGLFAINQAVNYAVRGKVRRDITLNCPEPTRSQLQALVDRIKADPTAGKPVIALLMKMRDLKKLELAEQQMQAEQQGDQPESPTTTHEGN